MSQISHFYHRHHLHRLARHSDFGSFELAIWLHTLAESLVWVFIPVILYRTGYSIGEILAYNLVFNCFDVPLNFVMHGLIRRFGARRILIGGTFAIVAFFGLLGALSPGNWPILCVLALLAALYDTSFWVSHMYMFIEINREGLDTGKTTGALNAVRRLAGVIGPAVGALVLVFLGKQSLTLVAMAFFTASIIPLFRMRHVHDLPKERGTSLRGFFSHWIERRNYLFTSLLGIHYEVDGTLWPLFIFLAFGSIGSVAAVPIIVSITTAAFSYLAGALTRRYEFKMIALGSFLISCMWVLRLAFVDPALYYATIFLIGFFSLLVAVPLDGSIASRGIEKGSLSASTYRNVSSMLPRILLYAGLLLLTEVFRVSFGVAAVAVFAMLLVTLAFASRQIHGTA